MDSNFWYRGTKAVDFRSIGFGVSPTSRRALGDAAAFELNGDA
jgi:hypothetical protein